MQRPGLKVWILEPKGSFRPKIVDGESARNNVFAVAEEQESQARREESVGAKRVEGPVQAMEVVDSEREGATVASSW